MAASFQVQGPRPASDKTRMGLMQWEVPRFACFAIAGALIAVGVRNRLVIVGCLGLAFACTEAVLWWRSRAKTTR